jgi:hypothetical protein
MLKGNIVKRHEIVYGVQLKKMRNACDILIHKPEQKNSETKKTYKVQMAL